MSLKTIYDLFFDSPVTANTIDIKSSAIIPANKTVRLQRFGGYDPNIGDNKAAIIALQWGSGSGWQTVRAGGMGVFDFELLKDFKGDGQKLFRLIRQNKSAENKIICVWLNAIVL